MDLSEFKHYSYPDGHKHIVSDKDLHGEETLSVSIKSFDDLFMASQVKAIHPELKNLFIKYMLAGRCDRRFSPGEALDLEIVCNYINSMGFQGVSVLRPHSDKTMELLNNARIVDVTYDILTVCREELAKVRGHVCYVIPDHGASRWIKPTDWHLESYITGNKKRNPDGRIEISFVKNDWSNKLSIDQLDRKKDYHNFVIIDDLCDGGGTFIEIAKKIKAAAPHARVYLAVTHAIFSKGFEPFQGWIDHIYCTNSFDNFDNKLVTQIKLP